MIGQVVPMSAKQRITLLAARAAGGIAAALSAPSSAVLSGDAPVPSSAFERLSPGRRPTLGTVPGAMVEKA